MRLVVPVRRVVGHGVKVRVSRDSRVMDVDLRMSTTVVFELVPRRKQHCIEFAEREHDDAAALSEGDDQFTEGPVRFRSAA